MKILENFINEMAVDPLADKIRQDLKKAGYKVPAQISVTTRRGGYSSAYDVTINDLKISSNEIEKLLKKYESYEYDQKTGEILAGGNTYIFVTYDSDVERKEEKRLRPLAAKFIDQALTDPGRDVVKLKNGYSFGIFPHVKDKEIEDMKMGRYNVYKSNEMFFVYKNNKRLPNHESFSTIWWLLARAGY